MLLTQLIDQPFGLTNSTKILNARKKKLNRSGDKLTRSTLERGLGLQQGKN
jgi:hypothetical protein